MARLGQGGPGHSLLWLRRELLVRDTAHEPGLHSRKPELGSGRLQSLCPVPPSAARVPLGTREPRLWMVLRWVVL